MYSCYGISDVFLFSRYQDGIKPVSFVSGFGGGGVLFVFLRWLSFGIICALLFTF